MNKALEILLAGGYQAAEPAFDDLFAGGGGASEESAGDSGDDLADDSANSEGVADGDDAGAAEGEEDENSASDGDGSQADDDPSAKSGHEPAKEDDILRKQVEQLQQQNQQLYQYLLNNQQNSQQKTAQEDQQKEPELPEYMFDIPKDIVEAVSSGEPDQVKAGLQQVIAGTAKSVHQQLRQEMGARIKEAQQQAIRGASTQVEQKTTAQRIKEDYYGTYKNHDREELYPLVQKVAGQAAKELGKRTWDQELRDEVGKRVNNILGQGTGAGQNNEQQQKKTQKQKPRAQKPAKQMSGNARPSAGGATEADDIIDTLLGD